MFKMIDVTELQRRFRFVFDEVVAQQTAFVLTRGGQPQVVLVSYQEYRRLQADQMEDALAQFDRAWDRLERLNADVDEDQLATDVEAARGE